MNPSKIEHIGIAVNDLESSVKFFESVFGLKCYKIEEVPEEKVRTAFFSLGKTKIELLESTDPEGPITRFIEKRGEGIHHIAIIVSGLEDRLVEAQKAGVMLIDHKPKPGADGMDIAFLHPKSTSGVLIELCESRKK